MPSGGKREGAGRKPNIPNKKTAALMAAVEASGLTPLDYMLKVMRDEGEQQGIRLDAAKSAAPYVHAKLASLDAKVNMDGQLVIQINKPS